MQASRQCNRSERTVRRKGHIIGAELLDFVKNKEDFSMVGGFFKPLTKPGLGVEIDEAKVIEFSKNAPDWRNPLWRHEDNSVAEW